MNAGISNCGCSSIIMSSYTMASPLSTSPSSSFSLRNFIEQKEGVLGYYCRIRTPVVVRSRNPRRLLGIVASSGVVSPSSDVWDDWKPVKGSSAPSLSDIVWPSAGAFAAMALLGKMDQILAPKGLSMTIAPLGAVCAVLFATPATPAARKYNMFMAHIGCAAISVLAFTIWGPGWLARSAGLAACVAYMIYTRSIHPPAASLPILFIDGAKLHHLNFWYALFPSAVGCILLSLIQEVVLYLKDNVKF